MQPRNRRRKSEDPGSAKRKQKRKPTIEERAKQILQQEEDEARAASIAEHVNAQLHRGSQGASNSQATAPPTTRSNPRQRGERTSAEARHDMEQYRLQHLDEIIDRLREEERQRATSQTSQQASMEFRLTQEQRRKELDGDRREANQPGSGGSQRQPSEEPPPPQPDQDVPRKMPRKLPNPSTCRENPKNPKKPAGEEDDEEKKPGPTSKPKTEGQPKTEGRN